MKRSISLFAAGLLCAALVACGKDSPESLMASARKYLVAHDRKAAVIQLKNALQQNPDLPEARFLLGKSLLDDNNPAGAVIELGKARDLKFPADQVDPELARALLAQGQFRKVTDTFATTVLGAPKDTADLKTSVAIAYAAQGDRPHAKAALDAALEAVPDYVPALLARSRELAGQHDFDRAFEFAGRALSKAPNDPDVVLWNGDLLLYGKKDEAAAMAAYRHALQLRAADPIAHERLLTLLLSRNELDAAKAQFQALQKLRPGDPQTRYFEARIALQSGDLKHAGEVVEQLQKVLPNNFRVLQLAGVVAYQKGSLLQAEQSLNQALQAAPGSVSTRRLLAQSYMRSGDSAKALSVVGPLLENAEPDAEALSLAGAAYLQSGNVDRAEALYSRAVKLDPTDARSRTALALVRLSRGKSDEAFSELESIAASDSGISADMALITASLRRKDFDTALTAIDRLEKKQPTKPLAPNLRGRVLLLRGDFDGARKNFERAVALDPAFFPAIESLAMLDIRDKKPEAARQRFDALLKREPGNSQALLALAQIESRTGKSRDEALKLINKAVNLNPTEVTPRLVLIAYLLENKEFKAALDAAQAANAALPNDPRLLEALGRSQMAAGDVNQAISSFGKLAAMQPNSAQVQVSLADAYVLAKSNDAAEASLRRALAISPGLLAAQQKLIALQVAAGKHGAALATAKEIQTQRPAASTGFADQGDIEVSRKDWNAAAAAYRIAQRKGPSTGVAEKLNAVLRAAGKRAEADTLASAWLKQHPKDTLFMFHLGNVALAEGNLAAAKTRFQQIIKLEPDNAFAHNNLAWTLARLKQDGALEHAEKANALVPNQPAFMDTLAMLWADAGRLAEATALEKKVVEMQPSNSAFRLNLAKIYIKAGDKSSARSELERLAKLGEKFPLQREVAELQRTL